MKIVFVTDTYNHHQADVANALYLLTEGNYAYITTKQISQERIKLGWSNDAPRFVLNYWEDSSKCNALIDTADIVIYGSVPFRIVKNRARSRKLLFCYSERAFKNVKAWIEYLPRMMKYRYEGGKYPNIYMLCASAYTAYDYTVSLCFKDRFFKWGYFPPLRVYDDIHRVIEKKNRNSILWVGRLLEWKHPELAVKAISSLIRYGYHIHLTIIGVGDMERSLKKLVTDLQISDNVSFLGAVPPEQVRSEMEKNRIMIASSDFGEGWGAVVNEAMNSGCVTIASHAIGSVPFLIQDGVNGYIFRNRSVDDLKKKLKFVLDHPEKAADISEKAYNTIYQRWNGGCAAKRLIEVTERLCNGESPFIFKDGPCSKALCIKNDWY